MGLRRYQSQDLKPHLARWVVRWQPKPKRPLRIWMDVGQYEWLLEPNRRTHTILQENGYDVAYREYNGGHNYPSWSNDVSYGLEWLFGKKNQDTD